MGKAKAAETTAITKQAENVAALIKRCDKGDKAALGELRKLLEEMPSLTKLYDVAGNAERSWLKNCSGEDETAKEFLSAELCQMRKEIGGPDPSSLERLLTERILLCWLQLQYADTLYAQNTNCRLTLGTYMQDSQDRAHRRYLSAIKALATIRKLGVSVLQVNIGDKQVNIAGNAPKLNGVETGQAPKALGAGEGEADSKCDLTAGDGG